MSDPINPNTLVPMSLEVEKIEQMRQVHSANEQQTLSQAQKEEDEKKKDRIFYGIEQLEEKHNKGHKLPDLLTDLCVVKRETEKELLIHSDEREYILGVQNTASKMTKKILDLLYLDDYI